jgi:hypothetical protein
MNSAPRRSQGKASSGPIVGDVLSRYVTNPRCRTHAYGSFGTPCQGNVQTVSVAPSSYSACMPAVVLEASSQLRGRLQWVPAARRTRSPSMTPRIG